MKASNMDTRTLARWAFIVGLVVAILIALVGEDEINEWVVWTMIVLGVFAGWAFFTTREAEHHFLLIAVGLVFFSQTLSQLPSIGEPITALLTSVATFFGVMVVALVVRNVIEWVRTAA
jgi:hypothetical protein